LKRNVTETLVTNILLQVVYKHNQKDMHRFMKWVLLA